MYAIIEIDGGGDTVVPNDLSDSLAPLRENVVAVLDQLTSSPSNLSRNGVILGAFEKRKRLTF